MLLSRSASCLFCLEHLDLSHVLLSMCHYIFGHWSSMNVPSSIWAFIDWSFTSSKVYHPISDKQPYNGRRHPHFASSLTAPWGVLNLSISLSSLTTPQILLNITCRLKTPDYCNVRSSCKTIEATLLNAFAREFFTKRQFMLTEFSLQALIDMSKSRFSSNIKHVIIGLERPWSLDQLPYVQQIGPNYLDNQKLLQSIYYTTVRIFHLSRPKPANNIQFLNSGQGAEMLVSVWRASSFSSDCLTFSDWGLFQPP